VEFKENGLRLLALILAWTVFSCTLPKVKTKTSAHHWVKKLTGKRWFLTRLLSSGKRTPKKPAHLEIVWTFHSGKPWGILISTVYAGHRILRRRKGRWRVLATNTLLFPGSKTDLFYRVSFPRKGHLKVHLHSSRGPLLGIMWFKRKLMFE